MQHFQLTHSCNVVQHATSERYDIRWLTWLSGPSLTFIHYSDVVVCQRQPLRLHVIIAFFFCIDLAWTASSTFCSSSDHLFHNFINIVAANFCRNSLITGSGGLWLLRHGVRLLVPEESRTSKDSVRLMIHSLCLVSESKCVLTAFGINPARIDSQHGTIQCTLNHLLFSFRCTFIINISFGHSASTLHHQ